MMNAIRALPSFRNLKPPRPCLLCRYGKAKSLQHVSEENREAVAQALDKVERAIEQWSVSVTDFLTPPAIAECLQALQPLADASGLAWGGFPNAERCRLLLGRQDVLAQADVSTSGHVCALQVKGNFMFDAAAHPDFLGACLGLGIDRRKIGDILVQGEQGAQILVAEEIAPFLEANLVQVRAVRVETQAIPLSALKVPPPRVVAITTVESSLRLDAIASAGFRVSRSKIADLAKSGDLKLNWKPRLKGSCDVKAGDIITLVGKGRVQVAGVAQNQKGKYVVDLTRFV